VIRKSEYIMKSSILSFCQLVPVVCAVVAGHNLNLTFARAASPIAQQAYLKASNTGTGDGFGHTMALSGDTLVVAAGNEDSNATGVNGDGSNNSATDSGAVYVF